MAALGYVLFSMLCVGVLAVTWTWASCLLTVKQLKQRAKARSYSSYEEASQEYYRVMHDLRNRNENG